MSKNAHTPDYEIPCNPDCVHLGEFSPNSMKCLECKVLKQQDSPSYRNILLLAADSPELLRKSDVFRILDEANQAESLMGFSAWLLRQSVQSTVAGEVKRILTEYWGV